MKNVIQHNSLGEIIYEESFWTGKKALYVNGNKLPTISKNVFCTDDGRTITIKGNFFTGVKGTMASETIALTTPCKWYEYVLAFIPLILIMIWGNSIALCEIVPVVGGAIGGFLSALIAMIDLYIIKNIKNVFLKILISIGMTGLAFLICFLVALAILAAAA